MVPPHRRDKVLSEKLQPPQRVEPGRFVPCWKERKKQAKSKVLRDRRPKRRKMEQPLLGKINTLTEKKQKQQKFVLWSKTTRTRLAVAKG